MSFPDSCLRGISVPDQMLDDGTVSTAAFNFSDKVRGDGFKELSIVWEDDEKAGEVLLNQKKDNGEFQFKVGYAFVPRNEIDHLIKQPTVNGMLNYERQELENNPYHGNILVHSNTSRHMIRKIQAYLALFVSSVVRREE